MRRLYGDRNRELAVQNALIARIQARFEPSIKKEIALRMRKAATSFEQYGDSGLKMAMDGHRQDIEGILSPLWTLSMERFAERVQVGKSRNAGIIESAIRYWFGNYAYDRIVNVADTTLNQLREIVSRGRNEGITQAQIGNRIREIAPQLSAYRADVIARTETHGSSQYGSISGAREVDDTLNKEWISAGDDRVRDGSDGSFDHTAVDGEVIRMNDQFVVDGEEMDYPGDDSHGASAGNIINCRCCVGYVRP